MGTKRGDEVSKAHSTRTPSRLTKSISKTLVLSVAAIREIEFQGVPNNALNLSAAFAGIVERERLKMGISRAELATRAGLHQSYVGLLERGKRAPNLDTANAVAKALGKPLSVLIQLAEQ